MLQDTGSCYRLTGCHRADARFYLAQEIGALLLVQPGVLKGGARATVMAAEMRT
jgi:hypothetical protein